MPVDDVPQYDIVISYAREDADWVVRQLYDPLVRCVLPDGGQPRVFLDTEKEGIPPGVGFTDFLAEAIRKCRTVVAAYSTAYFSKKMCRWELSKAHELDPTGDLGKLTPVLIDATAESSVPFKVSGIHFIDSRRQDWFEILCRRLGLEAPEEPAELEILDQPGDVTVLHTMPPIQVAVTRDGRRLPRHDTVTLTVERGALHGTVTAEAEDGVADFVDLSLGTVVEGTRLVASAEGCLPAFSEPFSVFPAPERTAEWKGSNIPATGDEIVFFDDEQALAVIGGERGERVNVFALDGSTISKVELGSRVRCRRRAGRHLVLATWSGEIVMLSSSGETSRWGLSSEDGGYTIPGDLQIVDGDIIVGLWNGRVTRLISDVSEPTLVLELATGVQRLAVAADLLCTLDLAGRLRIHREGRVVRDHQLEPLVRELVLKGGHLVAVGVHRLQRIRLPDGDLLGIEMPLSRAATVLAEPQWPIVVDDEGKGIVFDEELALRMAFHSSPGTRPICCDRDGRYCILRDTEGAHVVLEPGGRDESGRVTYVHPSGALAVAPSGELFAVAVSEEIRLLDDTGFRDLIAGDAGA